MPHSHSYEELRDAAVEVLSGRERSRSGYSIENFDGLKLSVGEVFQRREAAPSTRSELSRADAEQLREVFWDLFRQGILTPGLDEMNRDFPWFHVTERGRRMLAQQPFIPHDVEAYTRILRDAVPDLHDTTLIYLQEAMSAFRADCLLSATVMLGVATEHTFLLLMEDVIANPTWATRFQAAADQRTILQKLTKFRNVLDQHLKEIPADLREDLDTQFAGILSVIRSSRNESGHPTGKVPVREQVYVLLHLFLPHCKKIYALRRYFRAT
jgi:hypothetical protein